MKLPRRRLRARLAIACAALLMLAAAPLRAQELTVSEMQEQLAATPVLLNMDTARVREIFRRGQRLGNQPDAFSLVGDSNTTNGDFMRPLGLSANLCSFADYPHLRDTVAFFSTPLADGSANSFVRDSAAADRGLSALSLQDPFWADESCQSGETPLDCELRTIRPSVLISLIGQIDINHGLPDPQIYRDSMEWMLQRAIAQGTIPVLTTMVFLPQRAEYETSLRFNMVLLDLADDYQIPLINLWRAAQALPDSGIGPDRSHLAAEVGRFCAFDGAERELGGTLRNLLTLQALEALRLGVLAPG
jgi:hypothetical protein